MKRFLVVPVAALLLAACGESTAPNSTAQGLTLNPRADFVAAGLGDTYTFEGFTAAASPFSPNRTAVIPSDTYTQGGKGFLGKFTNEVVTIGTSYVGNGWLNFDLYIEGTWDGLAKGRYGIDTWTISAYCGTSTAGTPAETFTTTFSNKSTTKQSYPAAYGSGTYAGLTGAINLNQLGFAPDQVLTTNHAVSAYDAVYQMSWPYPVCPSGTTSVTFVLSAGSLQQATDEFWGIDNVRITSSSFYTTSNSWQ